MLLSKPRQFYHNQKARLQQIQFLNNKIVVKLSNRMYQMPIFQLFVIRFIQKLYMLNSYLLANMELQMFSKELAWHCRPILSKQGALFSFFSSPYIVKLVDEPNKKTIGHKLIVLLFSSEKFSVNIHIVLLIRIITVESLLRIVEFHENNGATTAVKKQSSKFATATLKNFQLFFRYCIVLPAFQISRSVCNLYPFYCFTQTEYVMRMFKFYSHILHI